jgi:hypothetical protein
MTFTAYKNVAVVMLLSVALLPGQSQPSKSLAGTVTGFQVDAHTRAILVEADNGGVSAIPFAPETEVVRVAPGDHELTKGEPGHITEILTGDRVLVSFVQGMTEARRIVLITATDIAKRNEANRLNWQNRGVAGVVASTNGNQIHLRAGQQNLTVTIDSQTIVRRYAPDSVRFADAGFSNVAQIVPGDQLQARGEKSDDGLTVKAQEIVFGTFLTKAGTITAVDPAANRVTIQELATKQPLRINLTADSRLRMVPDVHTMMDRVLGGAQPREEGPSEGPGGMAKMIDKAPPAKLEDLKLGGTIVVTSTKGKVNDEVTAIVLLANADFIVQMMQAAQGGHAPIGMPNMDEILKRHGVGAGGSFTLPAIIP